LSQWFRRLPSDMKCHEGAGALTLSMLVPIFPLPKTTIPGGIVAVCARHLLSGCWCDTERRPGKPALSVQLDTGPRVANECDGPEMR